MKKGFFNGRGISAGLAVIMATASLAGAAPASADITDILGGGRSTDRRQGDKNNMRTLGIVLGAAAAYSVLKGKTEQAAILGAGAAYAGKKYEDARKAQSRENDRDDWNYRRNDRNDSYNRNDRNDRDSDRNGRILRDGAYTGDIGQILRGGGNNDRRNDRNDRDNRDDRYSRDDRFDRDDRYTRDNRNNDNWNNRRNNEGRGDGRWDDNRNNRDNRQESRRFRYHNGKIVGYDLYRGDDRVAYYERLGNSDNYRFSHNY